MDSATSPSSGRPIGPYCRALQRGSIATSIDGRSTEGRFLRRVEAELKAQVGGEPSFTQSLLIRRVAKMMLRLELLDGKTKDGALSERDGREFGALTNAVRHALRDLSVKAAKHDPTPSLTDIVARHRSAGP